MRTNVRVVLGMRARGGGGGGHQELSLMHDIGGIGKRPLYVLIGTVVVARACRGTVHSARGVCVTQCVQ